jgi:RecA/RadA recombinase
MYLKSLCNFVYVVQKLGGNAMLVDAEHAFDPAYSKAVGVDVENLIVCQPDHGEMALESNTFDLWLCWNG